MATDTIETQYPEDVQHDQVELDSHSLDLVAFIIDLLE